MLSDSGKCICSRELTNIFRDTLCDLENQLISTQGGVWMKYHLEQTCIIAHSSCPFDYCTLSEVTFDITEPDNQCTFNRSGLLCGECAKGLSLLLGSNQCGECTNDYISLFMPFSLAGIALVALLILLNLTVSIGTINSLIFFANIVKLNEAVYFPNGLIISISQFISWLNLDLGIQTCLSGNGQLCQSLASVCFSVLHLINNSSHDYTCKIYQILQGHWENCSTCFSYFSAAVLHEVISSCYSYLVFFAN